VALEFNETWYVLELRKFNIVYSGIEYNREVCDDHYIECIQGFLDPDHLVISRSSYSDRRVKSPADQKIPYRLIVLDLQNKTQTCLSTPGGYIACFAKNPQHHSACVRIQFDFGHEDECWIMDTDTGTLLRKIEVPLEEDESICDLQYSPDGNWLGIVTWGSLYLYRTKDGSLSCNLPNACKCIAFDTESKQVATFPNYNDQKIEIHWLSDGSCQTQIDFFLSFWSSAAAATQSPWMLTHSPDGKLRLWDRSRGKLENEIPLSLVSEIAISQDGSTFQAKLRMGTCISGPIPDLQSLSPAEDGRWYTADRVYYWKSERDSNPSVFFHIFRSVDDKHVCTVSVDSREITYHLSVLANRLLHYKDSQKEYVFDLSDGSILLDSKKLDRIAVSPSYVVYVPEYKQKICIIPMEDLTAVSEYHTNIRYWNDRRTSEYAPWLKSDLRLSSDGKYLIECGNGLLLVHRTADFKVVAQTELKDGYLIDVGTETVLIRYQKNEGVLAVCKLDTLEPIFETPCIDAYPDLAVRHFNDHELLLSINGRDTLYFSEGADGWNHRHTFVIAPGLDVWDLDLRTLHSDPGFTESQKEILRQYGAIL
jgi:hypothetical protein